MVTMPVDKNAFRAHRELVPDSLIGRDTLSMFRGYTGGGNGVSHFVFFAWAWYIFDQYCLDAHILLYFTP